MKDNLLGLIKRQLEFVNEELDYDHLKTIDENTEIFGGEYGVDSLSLVKIVVGLEQDIQKEFGRQVLLSDEKAMSMKNSPYRTVRSLLDFAAEQLEASRVA